jgi:Tfp pilus assembly protein PilX
MNRHRLSSFPRAWKPRQERGTVLIIALIVLVAMTLAGIATMRSVDTATVMAGNIAFRQSAVNAADQGIQAGHAWLEATLNLGTNLSTSNNNPTMSSLGYFSNAPVNEPKWSDPAAWANAAYLNGGTPDAAGNVVSYKIQRMCPVENCAPGDVCSGVANTCGSTPDSTALSKEGQDHFRPTHSLGFTKPPVVHYRVTAKAEGPRRSVSVVQTMLRGI